MKKLSIILLLSITGLFLISCDNDPKKVTTPADTTPADTTPADTTPAVTTPTTDNDGNVYQAFTDDTGVYQVGYVENMTNGKDDIILSHDTVVANGLGSAKVVVKWSKSELYLGKVYISQYSDGKTGNAQIIDGTGKTLITKIKPPEGFLDGFDPDTTVENNEKFPGIKLYVKGTAWTESAKWFDALKIKETLAGADHSSDGIFKAAEEGFIILKAVIGSGKDIESTPNATIYEHGVVFEQNRDESLTDDMEFYIDYIDFATTK